MEDIPDTDCRHTKKAGEGSEKKNFGKYHDFHVQGDTVWLVEVFENSQKDTSWNR